MSTPELRNALQELSEQANTPDLLNNVLAKSAKIKRRRVAVTATSAVAVIVLIASVAVGAPWHDSSPVLPPPATQSSSPGVTSSAPASTSSSPSSPNGSSTTKGTTHVVPPAGTLDGTVYYLDRTGQSEYSVFAKTGSAAARVLATVPDSTSASISPDGEHVAWIRLPGSDGPAQLMVKPTDGGVAKAVASAANMGGLCNSTAWVDDESVLFAAGTVTAPIWSVAHLSGGVSPLANPAPGCYPTFTPGHDTIGWYANSVETGMLLTDPTGGNQRVIPSVDDIAAPCRGTVYAVSADANRALVSRPNPNNAACGDGPGRRSNDAVVVNTNTGNSIKAPVPGLATGIFLPNGNLVAITTDNRLVLLGTNMNLLDSTPTEQGEPILLAYHSTN